MIILINNEQLQFLFFIIFNKILYVILNLIKIFIILSSFLDKYIKKQFNF
jgi:hypothetical protein